MAYRYNERTGEFEDLPQDSSRPGNPSPSSSQGGTPPDGGSPSDFIKKAWKILKYVLPAVVAIAVPSAAAFIPRD